MSIDRRGQVVTRWPGSQEVGGSIRRVIPEHVKDPRAPVDKSRVLIPGITGQIPELLRIAVKLHRHHYR